MKGLTKLIEFYHTVVFKVFALFLLLSSPYALASTLSKTDLSKKGSGKFDDVAKNINDAAEWGAALLTQLATFGGFVVVAVSLFTLYKASKDEREKPTSAIVGLFVGGMLAAVGTIMWIMRNTVLDGVND